MAAPQLRRMEHPFRYFNGLPDAMRLAASPRQVADILFERAIDVCHGTVRFRWNRFGPMLALALAQIDPPAVILTIREIRAHLPGVMKTGLSSLAFRRASR